MLPTWKLSLREDRWIVWWSELTHLVSKLSSLHPPPPLHYTEHKMYLKDFVTEYLKTELSWKFRPSGVVGILWDFISKYTRETRCLSLHFHERQTCWMCDIPVGRHGGVRDTVWASSHACWDRGRNKIICSLTNKAVRTVMSLTTL